MSNVTLAPCVADATSVFPTPGADPILRFQQRLLAEQALNDLERSVRRLEQQISALAVRTQPNVPRRSRRSAWLHTI